MIQRERDSEKNREIETDGKTERQRKTVQKWAHYTEGQKAG